jgi:pimeloyl-ACP methyl ester carboxylesterase
MKRPERMGQTLILLAMGLVAACQPRASAAASPASTTAQQEEAAMATEQQETGAATVQPRTAGFVEVNGIRLWHEVYGEGEPLVLLHGGLTTIPEMMTMVGPLSRRRQVVALELQGHGRTADTDRPLAFATLGDDVAALIDALGLDRADVVGHSFGADVALRTAIQHPEKVRRLVVISTAYARNGWYPEVQTGMASVSSALADAMKEVPTAQFAREWPEPQRFPQFLDKLGKLMSEDYDWSGEIRKLPMPVMLVFADHDSVSQRHIADFFALLGGGITEPGWQNTKFTKARLAIIPGYSHYNLSSSGELPTIVDKFLGDPLTATQTGAAAASKAAPANPSR